MDGVERSEDLLTPRHVLKLAWPIILANIAVPLLGVVDTAVIGHLGAAAPLGACGRRPPKSKLRHTR